MKILFICDFHLKVLFFCGTAQLRKTPTYGKSFSLVFVAEYFQFKVFRFCGFNCKIWKFLLVPSPWLCQHSRCGFSNGKLSEVQADGKKYTKWEMHIKFPNWFIFCFGCFLLAKQFARELKIQLKKVLRINWTAFFGHLEVFRNYLKILEVLFNYS